LFCIFKVIYLLYKYNLKILLLLLKTVFYTYRNVPWWCHGAEDTMVL